MQRRTTENLRAAIEDAVDAVRSLHPVLSDADVAAAYRSYERHFRLREDDPPVSMEEATDDLLLAIWDTIVDRETGGVDRPQCELEAFYGEAFTHLLQPAPDAMERAPVAEAKHLVPAAAGAGPSGDVVPPIEVESGASYTPVYRLRLTLDGVRPEIYRILLVGSDLTQAQLHHVLQAAMGWRGTEQFQFFPPAHRELPGGEVTLGDVLVAEGELCGYEFDNWYHDIELLGREAASGDARYPKCVRGARACPPEDIGGVPEYNQMLEVLQDPGHPDYREMAGWLTQDFNPDAFNIEQTNLRLARYGQAAFRSVV